MMSNGTRLAVEVLILGVSTECFPLAMRLNLRLVCKALRDAVVPTIPRIRYRALETDVSAKQFLEKGWPSMLNTLVLRSDMPYESLMALMRADLPRLRDLGIAAGRDFTSPYYMSTIASGTCTWRSNIQKLCLEYSMESSLAKHASKGLEYLLCGEWKAVKCIIISVYQGRGHPLLPRNTDDDPTQNEDGDFAVDLARSFPSLEFIGVQPLDRDLICLTPRRLRYSLRKLKEYEVDAKVLWDCDIEALCQSSWLRTLRYLELQYLCPENSLASFMEALAEIPELAYLALAFVDKPNVEETASISEYKHAYTYPSLRALKTLRLNAQSTIHFDAVIGTIQFPSLTELRLEYGQGYHYDGATVPNSITWPGCAALNPRQFPLLAELYLKHIRLNKDGMLACGRIVGHGLQSFECTTHALKETRAFLSAIRSANGVSPLPLTKINLGTVGVQQFHSICNELLPLCPRFEKFVFQVTNRQVLKAIEAAILQEVIDPSQLDVDIRVKNFGSDQDWFLDFWLGVQL